MKFDRPAEANASDRLLVLGQPHSRVEGRLKTTGAAPYAYERQDVAEGQLYGYPLGAAISRGRILSMDTEAATAAPGVRAVVTTLDMDPLPKDSHNVNRLFGGADVEHYHQAIAVVVADTFEQARSATNLIKVEYHAEQATLDLSEVTPPETEPAADTGDFDTAFANAPVTLDEIYTTPAQTHAMMEPHASVAEWKDGKLTVWTSSQMIKWWRDALAKTLSLDVEDVRVESPYIGGGFGGKLFLRADAVLAALGSKATGRPVKLALPRPLMTNNTTHRAQTIQRIRLAADNDGKLIALGHDNLSNTPPGGDGEDATSQSLSFYGAPNMRIVNRVAEMKMPESNSMRAPGDAAGLMTLEIAMDEMAERLGMDPVEFRALNDTQVVPSNPKQKFSHRNFVDCLRHGAKEFGWTNPAPASRREGHWLIGQGMAGAYRGSPASTSGARVRLQADGRVIVETDMTDIGTGSYTILAQTAAEMMGLPIEKVEVRLGDSRYPVSSGSGGQFGAASSTAGLYAACVALRAQIAERLQADAATLDFRDGEVHDGTRSVSLASLASDGELVAEDKIEFGEFRSKEYELATFAAHFVETAVNAYTGEVRLRRMLAVCDAGRILNPITARSQVIGGMTMAVGAALMEHLEVDSGRAFFANHDLASYEVPVHLDIPEQTVIFMQQDDPYSTPLKAKGVGELGVCGVAAAVANAVYNATGVRVRDYPITLDRYLDRLPEV
ncbi:aldehyde oxidoreductase molybdenum-binding subunit PaoC [Falsirhodobacter sp. 20TX0035]|uniref:aldehyde oxidoreductase molybdenum-binding subunit PaoC n=1 Tax=Falsirhodobacter sp. 20TX0035 TaxID=3022019 RepID=UPI00232B4AA4|nr:aldehyde oxidoreductase molybdenum-binding subunit PaoC [Falsirhodobacter sp. 20TX0035]MDB6454337.1 xanthine dehydrogenase family protein molybdopterin-binding subunit [Falsirhodobacter sp. 20TX0035]